MLSHAESETERSRGTPEFYNFWFASQPLCGGPLVKESLRFEVYGGVVCTITTPL